MLSTMLSRIATEYAEERKSSFNESALRIYATSELTAEAKKITTFSPHSLKVKASVGQFSTWAAVPWLAFFDPLVSTGAQNGFYVVYLVNSVDKTFCLSLNQGTTEVYNEFGEKQGREVLKRRALDMRSRLSDYASDFDTSPIELVSDADLPAGYMAGHALGKTYEAFQVSEKVLVADLHKMLNAYSALIGRGGLLPTEVLTSDAETQDIEEARRYSLSKRIERSPRVRKDVLKAKKVLICEGCGLDPKKDYAFKGNDQNTPLDVHHAKPINTLQENETRRYRVPDDFMLLCPTCHRMIHKQDNPADLEQLKRSIRFKFSREVLY